jgi:hypothetical protein
MDTFNCSVHFLTLKQIGYEESNVAVTFYHDRTHFESQQRNLYAQFSEEFNLQQGRHFVLHNKLAAIPSKISKFKDQIKELDNLFSMSSNSTSTNDLLGSLKTDSKFKLGLSNVPGNIANSKLNSNDIFNYFHSYSQSNISKMIWLSTNRILIVMQDGTFVWLVIDTLSGDLVRVLVDNSLSNSLKLNGNVICDAALIMKNGQTPVFLFAYSDKSKLDFVTFAKSIQCREYLLQENTAYEAIKLEKLGHFEPTLKTFEYSCPSTCRIEKRLILSNDHSTFTLWWPNDGQIVWQPTVDLSLLERDDLRNNVFVLSANSNDNNPMECLFKSDGLLLSLSYSDDKSLIALEQTETQAQKYLLSVYKYEIGDLESRDAKSLKIKLTSFSVNSKIVSAEQVKATHKHILALTCDQTLVLYDLSRNIVNKFKLDHSQLILNSCEWLLEDLLFCVYNINGNLFVYDLGFNQIDLNYLTRYAIKFNSLSEYLNPNIFVPYDGSTSMSNTSVLSNNRFVRMISSRQIITDSLWSCFYYSKGPIGLFRLNLPDHFNCISLITHYIKSSHLIDQDETQGTLVLKNKPNKIKDLNNVYPSKHMTSAVNLLKALNWNDQAWLCLACLNRVMNFLLSNRCKFNLRIESLIEESLSTFYKPKRALNENIIYEYKHQVSRFARRYFYLLLRNTKLNKAFLLAIDIGAKDLFNDLYYCAVDRKETQLAEACRQKYHEIVDQENMEKLRIEFNRSVTTIDDNIKANSSEFDKYSISSSEPESIDSDSEVYSASLDFARNQFTSNLKGTQLTLTEFEYKKAMSLASNADLHEKNKFYGEDELNNFAKQIYEKNSYLFNSSL